MSGSDTRPVFLKGRKVILRPVCRETDMKNAQRWINDPDIRVFLTNRFPLTIGQESQWFERIEQEKGSSVHLAIETLCGRHIGFMGFHEIDYVSGVATTGTVIGEKDCWSRGFGTDAKMTFLHYAFNALNLRKICSRVYAFNPRSVRYSLKCGYVIEGRQRRHHFANGRYWDVILLAAFKPAFLRAWRKYQKA